MSKWLSKKGWIKQALSATSSNDFPKYGKAQIIEWIYIASNKESNSIGLLSDNKFLVKAHFTVEAVQKFYYDRKGKTLAEIKGGLISVKKYHIEPQLNCSLVSSTWPQCPLLWLQVSYIRKIDKVDTVKKMPSKVFWDKAEFVVVVEYFKFVGGEGNRQFEENVINSMYHPPFANRLRYLWRINQLQRITGLTSGNEVDIEQSLLKENFLVFIPRDQQEKLNAVPGFIYDGSESRKCIQAATSESHPSSLSLQEIEGPSSQTSQATSESLPFWSSLQEIEIPSSQTSQESHSKNDQLMYFPALQHSRKRKATEAVCLSSKSQLEELVGEQLSDSGLDNTSYSCQQLLQPIVPVGEHTSDTDLHNTSYIDQLIVPSSCLSPDSSRPCDKMYFPALCFKDHIKNKDFSVETDDPIQQSKVSSSTKADTESNEDFRLALSESESVVDSFTSESETSRSYLSFLTSLTKKNLVEPSPRDQEASQNTPDATKTKEENTWKSIKRRSKEIARQKLDLLNCSKSGSENEGGQIERDSKVDSVELPSAKENGKSSSDAKISGRSDSLEKSSAEVPSEVVFMNEIWSFYSEKAGPANLDLSPSPERSVLDRSLDKNDQTLKTSISPNMLSENSDKESPLTFSSPSFSSLPSYQLPKENKVFKSQKQRLVDSRHNLEQQHFCEQSSQQHSQREEQQIDKRSQEGGKVLLDESEVESEDESLTQRVKRFAFDYW